MRMEIIAYQELTVFFFPTGPCLFIQFLMHIHFVNHTLVLKINLLIVDSSKAEELA